MNKFQRALNSIKRGGSYQDLEYDFDVLQELINEYDAYKMIATKYIKRLDKALDKAIDNLIIDDRELYKHDMFCEQLSKEEWLSYLLSEECDEQA